MEAEPVTHYKKLLNETEQLRHEIEILKLQISTLKTERGPREIC